MKKFLAVIVITVFLSSAIALAGFVDLLNTITSKIEALESNSVTGLSVGNAITGFTINNGGAYSYCTSDAQCNSGLCCITGANDLNGVINNRCHSLYSVRDGNVGGGTCMSGPLIDLPEPQEGKLWDPCEVSADCNPGLCCIVGASQFTESYFDNTCQRIPPRRGWCVEEAPSPLPHELKKRWDDCSSNDECNYGLCCRINAGPIIGQTCQNIDSRLGECMPGPVRQSLPTTTTLIVVDPDGNLHGQPCASTSDCKQGLCCIAGSTDHRNPNNECHYYVDTHDGSCLGFATTTTAPLPPLGTGDHGDRCDSNARCKVQFCCMLNPNPMFDHECHGPAETFTNTGGTCMGGGTGINTTPSLGVPGSDCTANTDCRAGLCCVTNSPVPLEYPNNECRAFDSVRFVGADCMPGSFTPIPGSDFTPTPEQPTPEVPPLNCKETDGGRNPKEPGTVSFPDQATRSYTSVSDSCLSLRQLQEYYCNPDNTLGVATYSCSYCVNAVCVVAEESSEGTQGKPAVSYCPDINRDGTINQQDITIVSNAYGKSDCLPYDCDSNDDGVIDLFEDVFAVLNANGKSISEFPGCAGAVQGTPVEPITSRCTDSDGGRNYYVKGSTFANEVKSIDSCSIPDGLGGFAFVSDCTDQNCYVHEYYCNSAVSDYPVFGENVQCPNGCSNGACVTGTTIPATIKVIVFPDKNSNGIPDSGESFGTAGDIAFSSSVAKVFAKNPSGESADMTSTFSAQGLLVLQLRVPGNHFFQIVPGTGWKLAKYAFAEYPKSGCTLVRDSYGNNFYACGYDINGNTITISPNSGEELKLYLGVNSVSPTTSSCTDSDNGINYDVKGTTTICFAGVSCVDVPDICDGNVLVEGYCTGDQGTATRYACPNGCSNGACVAVPSTVTCTDSDNGINYNVQGSTVVCDIGQNISSCSKVLDACDGNVLVEGYCIGAQRSTTRYACPNGCSNGACLSTTGIRPPCNYFGDVDLDGYVTSIDANLVLQHASGLITLSGEKLARAEVNGDGKVDSIDSNLILQYTAGKISTFIVCSGTVTTLPPTTCTRAAPTVDLSPASQTGKPGQVLSYTITVRNNDINCGSSTFTISSFCSSAISCSLPNPLVIASGSSASVAVTVAPLSTAKDGTYAIEYKATNKDSAKYGRDSSTYVLSAASSTSLTPYCPDINRNGVVDQKDIDIVTAAFGQTNCSPYDCDLNNDGIIDLFNDLFAVSNAVGTSVSQYTC